MQWQCASSFLHGMCQLPLVQPLPGSRYHLNLTPIMALGQGYTDMTKDLNELSEDAQATIIEQRREIDMLTDALKETKQTLRKRLELGNQRLDIGMNSQAIQDLNAVHRAHILHLDTELAKANSTITELNEREGDNSALIEELIDMLSKHEPEVAEIIKNAYHQEDKA